MAVGMLLLPLLLAAGSTLAAQMHCPLSPPGRRPPGPPPPPLLVGEVVHTSRVLTAGPYCANFHPPHPPAPPPGAPQRLVVVAPCLMPPHDALQRWEFTAEGALQLQHDASSCVTQNAQPVLLEPCHDASGSPSDLPKAQRWGWDAHLGVVFNNIGSSAGAPGGHGGCLNIRENTAPVHGEKTGDIHAGTHGCFPAPGRAPDANFRWLWNSSSGHLVSNCSDKGARWKGMCITAEPPLSPPAAAVASPSSSLVPTESGGDCGGYFDYGGPSCVLSANETLLCFFAGEKLVHRDDNDWTDLVLRRSFDKGVTWQPLQVVASDNNASTPPSQWQTYGNEAAVLDRRTGTIWLLFDRNNTGLLVTHSSDHGASWTTPTDITQETKPASWGWIAVSFSGVQLRVGPKAGRLVVALDYFDNGQHSAYPITDMKSGVLYSDDAGASWQVGGHSQINMTDNEAAISELADGTLVLNSRNYLGTSHYGTLAPYGENRSGWMHPVHRGLSFSTDSGGSFSDTYHASDLVEPVCEGSQLTGWDTPLSLGVQGNSTLFFANPSASYARVNLTLKMSVDGGCRWSEVLLVNQGTSMYSSVVQFSDGDIGVAFDDGSDIICPPKAAYGCGHNNETFRLVRLSRANAITW